MKKHRLTLSSLLLSSALLLPVAPVWAGHDMAGMAGMDMGGDKTIMLETAHEDGVMAMVHLNDVSAAMAKNGMKETHHMMVMFSAMQDGKPITGGTVAVKVIDPAGVKTAPIKMMLMGDGFGADVNLAAAGKYSFEVGTKLADGKKRLFTFTYDKK